MSGQFVDLPEILDDFESMLAGTVDDLPENAFYMVGGLASAKEKSIEMMKNL